MLFSIKNLLDFLGEILVITGNSTADGFIIALIGIFSFSIAFGFVGLLFDFFGFYDSDLMSGVHWFIRLIIFLTLTFACLWFVHFIKKYFIPYWWAFLLGLLLVVGIIIGIHFLKHYYSKKKYKKVDDEDEEILENTAEAISPKEICPRCGGRLIKRQGPYGTFYGCENYSSQNCKYTRKFK